MREIEVLVEIVREGAALPSYANPWDAGMDVCAACDTLIRPGETVIVPTGLKLAIPEGYEIQVRPRSGISLNTPLRISNSPGTIDAGYRDELGIIMTNASPQNQPDGGEPLRVSSKGNRQGTYLIRKGDRIAQLVLAEVPRMRLRVVDSVKEIGRDRGGGFGSTGVK
ncbi:MAG: aminotransferase [Clostridiaceae bacterium]|jgi:dUTP pyrophosphatase|nr:aminotransferase [Clostridiaceae bacterium]